MVKQTLYDPFTKITPFEKRAIARFLTENSEKGVVIDQQKLSSALDAAVKEIPSFGGFILTMSDEDGIIALIVVNHTGMEQFGPGHIISFFATQKAQHNVGIGRKLLLNALNKLKGNVALHLPANTPDKELFEELGFSETHVEMQLQKNKQKSHNTSKIA